MDVRQDVLERFLRYVKIDTQSKDGVEDRYPSTPGQLELLALLERELRDLGLQDAAMDEHGYVMATLPERVPAGTKRAADVPCVGLLAHVDTYHEVSGKDVKPIIHRSYQGGVIQLPRAPDKALDPAQNPELKAFVGDDLITSDGSTLLGADDKAGVAEIMTLLALFRADPSLPHPRIRVGFTPDEEVGGGTKFFDVAKFGAQVAYTQDGSGVGEVEDETFCADTASITIEGTDVHPGYAKGKMVNAARLAARLVSRVPADSVPETTDGRQDYLHPFQVTGNVSQARVVCLVRSFSEQGLHHMEEVLAGLCDELRREEPRARVSLEIKESYRNMKVVLDRFPWVVTYAEDAMRVLQVAPVRKAIRGGTDGARLSFQGLPTPNLSAGGYNFHSVQEWVAVGGMSRAVEVLVALMKLFVERGQPPAPSA